MYMYERHLFVCLSIGGATGDIVLDDNADRIPDYWLFDLREDETFQIIAQTTSTTSANRRKREDADRQRRAITRVKECPKITQSYYFILYKM